MRRRSGILAVFTAASAGVLVALAFGPELRGGAATEACSVLPAAREASTPRALHRGARELEAPPGASASDTLDAAGVRVERIVPDHALRGRLVDAATGAPLAGRVVELRVCADASRFAAKLEPDGARALRFAAELRGLLQKRVIAGPGAEITLPAVSNTGESSSVLVVAAGGIHFGDEDPDDGVAQGSSEARSALFQTILARTMHARDALGAAEAPEAPAALGYVELQWGRGLHETAAEPVPEPDPSVGSADASSEMEPTLAPRPERSFDTVDLGAVVRITAVPLVPAGDGPRPQLLDAGAIAPVPLSLTFAPSLVAGTTTTDADGRFRFDCPDGAVHSLQLVLADEEWSADAEYGFLEPERACDAEFTWRVELLPSAHVRGRVLDATTNAPVAELELLLRGAGDAEFRVTTDADGRFDVDGKVPAGGLALSARDVSDLDLDLDVELAPASAQAVSGENELLLFADIGPTWRLEFQHEYDEEGEPVCTPLESRLVEVRLALGAAGPARDGGEPPFDAWIPLRVDESDAGWFRLPRPVPLGGAVAARFQTRDRAWVGSARLVRGPAAQLVVLHASSGLDVHAERARDGAADAWRARVVDAFDAVLDEEPLDADGDAEFRGLDGGLARAVELWRGTERLLRRPLALAPSEERALEL